MHRARLMEVIIRGTIGDDGRLEALVDRYL